ncbi:hypothetical protein ANN_24545 [Periplaneta americana]|uniref:Uncharacterized protein n=1 Tax=Periplaneta americana TaxID=6978 RepID=A0ABQ8S3B0_PERAM|nr:hypothetical protein ANN_24545 [Periplaneta americana]
MAGLCEGGNEPSGSLKAICKRAASATELAVKKKVNKYAHLLENYIFVPFAVETFGPWGHDAKVLVSQIGQILISITGDRRCTTYLRQHLSIAIQRRNAMSVLGTLPESSPLEELFLLQNSLLAERKQFTEYLKMPLSKAVVVNSMPCDVISGSSEARCARVSLPRAQRRLAMVVAFS